MRLELPSHEANGLLSTRIHRCRRNRPSRGRSAGSWYPLAESTSTGYSPITPGAARAPVRFRGALIIFPAARRLVSLALAIGLLLGTAATPPEAVALTSLASPSLRGPQQAASGQSFAVRLTLPPGVAAVDGRVSFAAGAAELIGVAPAGGGVSLRPATTEAGGAFAAYDLDAASAAALDIVIYPHRAGRLEVRVVVDTAADARGAVVALSAASQVVTVPIGRDLARLAAPALAQREPAPREGRAARELEANGRIDIMDLDSARFAWSESREDAAGAAPGCGASASEDPNRDGCTDIADVQATLASQGVQLGATALAPAADRTFTVRSTADTSDASPGNGTCADSQGRCTLRAAIMESNQVAGHDTIRFALSGNAPVLIQLSSRLPNISARNGGVTIDGYSQSGSRVNTATVGSNAIPGVEIRGTGTGSGNTAFRITSPNNTLRGLLIHNVNRAIFVDGDDAHHNRILGNWIGFRRDGNPSALGGLHIVLNNGAHDNVIGTPALADRNVNGNVSHAIELYGPGTDDNVIQNNLLCTTPGGFVTANCTIGIDFNFGPKGNLIGGTAANARNVVGRTGSQAIELSHGWNPAGGGSTAEFQINDNRVIGNWLGFRADGSFHPAFRSGQNHPGTSDNGQGVNVYDGTNDNVIEGNHISAVYDGIVLASGNAQRNVARDNVIGVSPLGQDAPLSWWGIRLRQGTKQHIIKGNVIRNAGSGGIGLIQAGVAQVRISQNIVTDTNGWAIDLFGRSGPDPNDSGDGDSGANTLLNTPVIAEATTAIIRGNGLPGAAVEVFQATRSAGGFGLPESYLGRTTVAPDGTWHLVADVDSGDRVTALQIRNDRDTSELSANRQVVTAPPNDRPVAHFTETCDGLTCQFTDLSRDRDGSIIGRRWTFGDGDGASTQNPTHSFDGRGTYRIKLTVTDDDGGQSTTAHRVTVVSSGPLARDRFNRRISRGWGRADVGGRWKLKGTAAGYAVDGSRGKIRLPRAGATRAATLGPVYARDVDLRVQVAANKPSSGGNLYAFLDARYDSAATQYRARMRIAPNGRVFVQAIRVIKGNTTPIGDEVRVRGLTYTRGARIWLQARFKGASPTTIRIQAWRGSKRPSGWAYVATDRRITLQDAGRMGVRAHLERGASQAPVVLRWEGFRAKPV